MSVADMIRTLQKNAAQQSRPAQTPGGIMGALAGTALKQQQAMALATEMKDIALVVGGVVDDLLRDNVRPFVPGANIPVFSKWRDQMRALEYILTMVLIYEFFAHQSEHFRDLETAAKDGERRMRELLVAAPKLREAITTIFLNAGEESARRTVRDFKAKAPKEFWDFLWVVASLKK